MIEIREMLRLWLQGLGLREVARLSGTDRKTVRRYVDRARACGLDRDGGACQLTDELLAAVIAGVRPSRPNGKSQAWETIAAQHDQIKVWLKQGLTLTKVHTLLGRRGVVVSYRTLHRYAVTELEFGQRQTTVRVADGEPGAELQVDFGRLGVLTDAEDGRRRVVQGLIFTAVYSRHMFVWPTYRQTLGDVIAGFEAAWVFFGGVFAVVIPDNMKAIVDKADATDPKLNDAFREYAQARGFAVDPARVRSPRDKPRVERCVPYVRSNFFAGEEFRDSATARYAPSGGVGRWRGCGCTAPPGCALPRCSPPTSSPRSNRHPMRCSTSRPGPIPRSPRIGTCRSPRRSTASPVSWSDAGWMPACDAHTVKLYWRGELIKVHPVVAPGRRHTDPADLPAEVSVYAMRDLNTLAAQGLRARHSCRRVRRGGAGASAAVDQDAPGLPTARAGAPPRRRRGRRRLPPRPGHRGHRRRAHRPHAAPAAPASSYRSYRHRQAASRFVRASTDFAVRRPS